MENNSIEMGLMGSEEREELSFIWKMLPSEDRANMCENDVLAILDAMDDYLEEVGLLHVDEKTGEIEYLDGEVDETEQLEYVYNVLHEQGSTITHVQIQLVMDAELQYGIQQGYYKEE